MSAGRLSISLIVLSVLPGVLGTVIDNCDSSATKDGYIDCVSFPSKYKDYQWAVCASHGDISRNSNYRCHGSFCWLPCMEITTGRKSGMVSQSCKCKPSNLKVRSMQTLDLFCYLPSSNYSKWFTDCVSKTKDCPWSSSASADLSGRYLCNLFDSHSKYLSGGGNQYIKSLKECLQNEIFHLILPSSNHTCMDSTFIAQEAHDTCLKLYSLTTVFCNLPVNDQSYIFWTSKTVLTNAFGSAGRDMLDTIRNCYHGNVQSVEQQIMFTVDAVGWKGVQPTVDDFARMLNWSSNGIVWDGRSIPQVSTSIKTIELLFKPEVDFDFSISRQSRAAANLKFLLDYKTILLALMSLKVTGKISEVTFPKKDIIFVPKLGECPYHRGGGFIFNMLSPESLNKINVQFTMYQKQNSVTRKESLDYFDDETITKSSYNSNKRTYFIIHGFLNDGEEDWILSMVSAFLENDQCNVIVVDWKKGADIHVTEAVLSAIIGFLKHPAVAVGSPAFSIAVDYIQAAVNTRLVGCLLGKMTEKLTNLMKTNYTDIHIVGHSLGAHVSGFAGLYTQGKIGRITGLDPAGPGFRGEGPNFRLDQTDAIFVDIIHSDTLSFGIGKPIGHIDFYPNGGKFQPGCILYGCSHGRANSLFTESISRACDFRACLCSRDDFKKGNCNTGTCTTMGFRVDPNKRGSFFLKTNKESPFCIK